MRELWSLLRFITLQIQEAFDWRFEGQGCLDSAWDDLPMYVLHSYLRGGKHPSRERGH